MKIRIIALAAFLLLTAGVWADVVVQAESGTFTGKTDTQHAGYTGTGFVDLTNAVGSALTVQFSIAEDMPSANVKVRWANGKSDDRAMSFSVNGTMQVASQAFGSSGGFTTWLETTVILNLRKGTNTITLTSLTANGGPNLDKLTIVGASEGYKEFPLNISILGKGSVRKTPDAPFYAKGTVVQLEALPDTTSKATFLGWSGDVSGTSLTTSILVDTLKNVTASFKSLIHTKIYCAPLEKGGDDANPGTISAPVYNISRAVAMAEPGDSIFVRGGTYRYKATIFLSKSGNPQEYYNIFNYPGEKPVLNFYDIFSSYTALDATARGEARGFKITGNYYHLKGLEICQAPDNGIKIEGSYNICEQLVLHHNGDGGIQIGLAKEVPDAADAVCNNLIKNCDAYRNLDWGTGYENADGFSCKLSPGARNRFVGCRAWENSDDGWDFYMTHYTIYVDSCWTMGNGNPDLIVTNDPDWEYGQKNTAPTTWNGDGNGFKLGGDGWAAKHQISNCISFDGYSTGACYSENNNADSLFIYNCIGWQGMKNFRVRAFPSDLRNNISFDAKVGGEAQLFDLAAGTTEKNNSWNTINGAAALVPYKTPSGATYDQKSVYNQFVSTSKADFLAPREPDGSLPKNGFGRLKPGSAFIDKGTGVVRGINRQTLRSYDFNLTGFYGTAPDLGAYEYYSPTGIFAPEHNSTNFRIYPNPFTGSVTVEIEADYSGQVQLVMKDLSGRMVYSHIESGLISAEKRTVFLQPGLPEGVYLMEYINGKTHKVQKLIKL